MNDKIIIYGGSFDPLHNGHVEIAKAASDYLGCPLLFVPAKNARWKDNDASPKDRLAMLNIACDELNKTEKRFSVSDYEITIPGDGPSYSVDTILHFKKEYNTLYFIIGADQVNLFDKWKDPDTIASNAQIYYVPRHGYPLNEEIIKRFDMKPMPFKEHEVSSTDIREMKSIDYPDYIRHYVEANGLYFIKGMSKYLKQTRLNHSIRVANVALDIARNNQDALDPLKTYQAAILHDIGKYIPDDKSKDIVAKEYSKEYSEYPYWALHQWVGAYLAEREFGIKDKDILDSIAYHCTGRAEMGPLEQTIYSADKIEPGRGYDSSDLIASCIKDYHQGFLDVLAANRIYLAEKTKDTPHNNSCPLTEESYSYFLDKKEGMN